MEDIPRDNALHPHAFDPEYEAEQNRRMFEGDVNDDVIADGHESPHAFARRADHAASNVSIEDGLMMTIFVFWLMFLCGLIASVSAGQMKSNGRQHKTGLQRLISIEHNPHQAWGWSLTPDEMRSLRLHDKLFNTASTEPITLESLLNPNAEVNDILNHFPDQHLLNDVILEKRTSRSDAGSIDIPSDDVNEDQSAFTSCHTPVQRVDCGHQSACSMRGTCELAKTSCVNSYQYHDMKCRCAIGWSGKWCERASA